MDQELFGESHAAIYRALMRNAALFQKIDSFIENGKNHVLVVGALHLVGADTLIPYFREKGYQVFALHD